jgi:hypothetical protein
MCNADGGGNTPRTSEGYYRGQPCGATTHKRFCNVSESASEVSTQTHGGDAFSTRLAKNHRFDSSVLNLAFEGLLLEVSRRLHAKGTRSEPSESGFWFMTLSFTQKDRL